jgi:hypothetical protein
MTLENGRDIAIIILAVLAMIQVILTIFLLYVVARLALYVRGRVPPILDSAQTTARTVEATANTIGDNLVKPVIATASFAVGVREFFSALTGGSKRRKG